MKRVMITILTGTLLIGSAAMSFADDTIKDRKQNQQKRIAQGVKSGSLTPRETARLEHNDRGGQIRAEPVGHDRSGRACSHNDVVGVQPAGV